MSRAYGWNAQLLIAEENEYGVPPGRKLSENPVYFLIFGQRAKSCIV